MNKAFSLLLKKMKDINPSGILIDSKYNDCIIGIGENFQGTVLVYDEDKIIKVLLKKMIEEDAFDYFDTAILPEKYGQYTPIFLISLKRNYL